MAEIQDLSSVAAAHGRFPEAQAPSSLNDGARNLEGIISRWFFDMNYSVVATLSGSVIQLTTNRVSITLTGTTSNYYAGLVQTFTMGSNPTVDGVSIRLNDIQTLSLRDALGNSLSSSAIPAGARATVIKDNTNNYFRLLFDIHSFINKTFLGTTTAKGQLNLAAATAAIASLNMPHGTAPSSPANGDMWTDAAGLYVRLNGATAQLETVTEGTWTPSDGSGAGLSFTVSKAIYRKIGNTVWIQVALTYPATADGTSAQITGLPVTVPSGAAANRNFFRVVRGTDANSVVGEFIDGTSNLTFRTAADTSVGSANSQFTGKAVAFVAMYSAT